MRFFTWIFITLFLALGAGLYWKHQGQNESKAGTTTSAPETSNTRASTGLASHWTFDREHISGTTITDRVGSNTGTSSGSPTAAIGKFGQALDFDGSDDHVNVTSAASLDIDATEDFSLAGWFNRDTFASDHTIVAKRNGQADTDDGYIVYIDDTTDQLIFALSDTADTDTYSVASTATFTASGWHHFVVVWDQDSATGTEVYIDGAASGTDTGTIANVGDLTEAVDFRIGSESDGGSRFDGRLDDIRFYSTALSASDVYQLSTAGTATVNAPVEDPLSQGLLGYWKMDEGTGTSTTADSSGNATTHTMTAMESGDWVTGQIGPYALDFDGSAEYLTVADPAILDFADGASFSITGWFNRDLAADDDTIIAKKTDQSTNAGYVVWIDNNASDDRLYFRAYEASGSDYREIASSTAFNTTGWHHFAVSWQDNVAVNLYIDGKLDMDDGLDGGTFANVTSLANANDFRIGAESGTADSFFDGKLDDIRVYGYPLSADQVLKLYQTTAPAEPVDTGLVGHWTFDGPDIQNLTAIDRSGKGNHGTMTGTTKAIGKLGQGLSFNGTNDYVNVGDLNNATDGVSYLTVSAWVKQSAHVASYKSPLGKYNGLNEHWNIMTDEYGGTGGYYDVRVRIDYNNYGQTIGTKIHKINEWEHWVMVFDGTQTGNENRLKFYFNGSQQELYLVGTIPSVTNSSNDSVVIGDRGSDAPQYSWNGSIDDVRIYNRAFSASEVLQLYNLGK